MPLTLPSGVQPGDTLVIFAASGAATKTFTVAPGTWQLLGSQSVNGSDALFEHVYTGTEGWTPGVTAFTVSFAAAIAGAWVGAVGLSDGIDGTQYEVTANAAAMTISLGPLTPSEPQDLILAFWGIGTGVGGTPPAINIPAEFTPAGSQMDTTAPSGTNIGILAATWGAISAGPTGPMNGTVATNHIGEAAAVAFLSNFAKATGTATVTDTGQGAASPATDVHRGSASTTAPQGAATAGSANQGASAVSDLGAGTATPPH